MRESTMTLIGDDGPLIAMVGRIVRSIEGLELEIITRADTELGRPVDPSSALVLIHQKPSDPLAWVKAQVGLLSSSGRSMTSLVLAETHEAGHSNELLRLGAADYLGLPVDPSHLAYLIESFTAGDRRGGFLGKSPSVADARRSGVEPGPILDEDSAATARLLLQIRQVAPRDPTIVIEGEAGTGKTRLARRIHDLSPRRHEPFVVVDCLAVDRASIEGELFGSARGGVPGAGDDPAGKLVGAGRGTILIDAVASLPLPVQSRLLRAIEDRAYESDGSSRPANRSARLIVANRRPLVQEVADGRFRSDLFHRLNVVNFGLPPLNERRETIGPLASRFARNSAIALGLGAVSVSPSAIRALEDHVWSGNVRELRDLIERAVGLAGGREINRDDLADSLAAGASFSIAAAFGFVETLEPTNRDPIARTESLDELDRINEALKKHGNNRLRAAGELGISRMTLYKKLYKYGLMESIRSRGGVS